MGERRPANNPLTGAAFLLRGFALLFRGGMGRYVAGPLAVNGVLFGAVLYLGWSHLPAVRAYLEGWLPVWLDFLSWLLLPIFVLVAALLVFFGFSVVGNLIAAPFNGLLSEAVERRLGGRPDTGPTDLARLAREALRDILSQARKLGYLLTRGLPLLALFLVPGLNLLAPFLWLLFAGWVLAMEYLDYPLANNGLGFEAQRALLRSRRLLVLGFGGAVSLALLVPGLNLLVIPAAVAGATALWAEQLKPVAQDTGREGTP